MLKKLFKLTLWIFGTLALLFTLFTVVVFWKEEEIKIKVVDQINEQLDGEIDVQNFGVSLQKFPKAALLFEEVYSAGKNSKEGDTLLYAQELFIEFDVWNIFQDELEIKSLSIHNGVIQILRPKNGTPNYLIWKEKSSNEESAWHLEKLSLKNVDLYQWEERVNQHLNSTIHEGEISIDYKDEHFDITAQLNSWVKNLTVNNQKYLTNQPLELTGNLNGNTSHFVLQNGKATSHGIGLSFSFSQNKNQFKLNAQQKGADLAAWQHFAESQLMHKPYNFKVEGSGSFAINYQYHPDLGHQIEAKASSQKSGFNAFEKGHLSDLAFEAHYTLKHGLDELHIKSLNGQARTGKVQASGYIKNLKRPQVSLQLRSELDLAELLLFVPLDTLHKPIGKTTLNLHFQNNFKSFDAIKPSEFKNAKASGSFTLNEAGFSFKGSNKQVSHVNAEIQFLGNDLHINNLFFRTGQSDVYLNGQVQNVWNYLFFENQQLNIDANVKSQEIVMEDFLMKQASKSDTPPLHFVKSLQLNLNLEASKFRFENFYAENIKGELQVKNQVFKARNLSLQADEGSFAGQFSLNTQNSKKYQLHARLNANHFNINQLFKSFNDFGQDAITAQNISGTGTAQAVLNCQLNPDLSIRIPSIDLQSQLEISDGKLQNYQPLMALSDFASISELKDVQFETMKNNISIKNETVFIPSMRINSSVMDIGLEGMHSFKNEINYDLEIKLSDVLFAKRKKKKTSSEFDEHLVEIAHQEYPTVLVKMTGTVDKPLIELNKVSLSSTLSNSLKQEKKNLKNIFGKNPKEPKKPANGGLQFDLFGEENDSIKK